MEIRLYRKTEDEDRIMHLIESEGEAWSCYYAPAVCGKYKAALALSITYVAYEDDRLVGYSRSLDDCGFYVYICDLLVSPDYRGQGIGKQLMSCLGEDYPGQVVYVMSDVDDYYLKQGFQREGSIFEVKL